MSLIHTCQSCGTEFISGIYRVNCVQCSTTKRGIAKGKRYVDLAEYKRVESQCKLLLKALKKYGHHTVDCMLNDVLRRGRGHRDYACKCGYSHALTVPTSGVPHE